jgi:hypothetical protein
MKCWWCDIKNNIEREKFRSNGGRQSNASVGVLLASCQVPAVVLRRLLHRGAILLGHPATRSSAPSKSTKPRRQAVNCERPRWLIWAWCDATLLLDRWILNLFTYTCILIIYIYFYWNLEYLFEYPCHIIGPVLGTVQYEWSRGINAHTL